MKKYLVILSLLLVIGLSAQPADSLDCIKMPQYTNPFYEAFSRNYLGVEAAGRGYTGCGVPGSAQGALLNPAIIQADSTRIFTEINIKPSVEVEGLAFSSRYSSTAPLGMMGVSFPLGAKIAGAVVYANPKSLILDDFSVVINAEGYVEVRYPKYFMHQFSGVARYQMTSQLNLGLGLHNQVHYLDDVIFLKTFDRVREYKYLIRFQPGVFYQYGGLGAGLSAVLPTNFDWDLRYAEYDSTLPLELSAGLSYGWDIYRVAGDFCFVQNSAIDERYDDGISVHFGAERRGGNNVLRGGYFYRSNVWDGDLVLPVVNEEDDPDIIPDPSIWWDAVSTKLPVKNNEQHFLTVGFGYLFKHGSLNLSALSTVASDSKCTQVNLSLSLYIKSFGQKDFMKFK